MAGPNIRVEFEVTGTKEIIAALKKAGVDVNNLLPDAAVSGGNVIEDEANREAPGPHIVKTKPKKVGKGKWEILIGPDKEHFYYQFEETGAVAHLIVAQQVQTLQFPMGGEDVFRTEVLHPGRSRKPFLRPALDDSERPVINAVGRTLKKGIPK